ncbi:MAG: hypothetical protein RR576_10055 [Oscillospiraceae bacterium]
MDLSTELKGISSTKLNEIPKQLCNCLIKKGLSVKQAKALLEYTKTLIENAEI